MLVRGSLVVKVSRDRAAAIVASGTGVAFDPGHGRRMREWVEVSEARVDSWPELTREAYEFAESASKGTSGSRRSARHRGQR